MIHTRGTLVAALALVTLLACTHHEKGPGVTIARGNEPFWAVSIDGNEARLRTPDEPDGIGYRDGRWKRDSVGAPWTFRARRERAEGLRLELEITEARCTDSMSGAESEFQAVLTVDEKRMEGCASK